MKRTDIHRPAAINPEDYQFICVKYLWTKDDIGEVYVNAESNKIFRAHMEQTGAKFSQHEHGGTCYCCGAHARFVARYYHAKTNKYIDLGERCAMKMEDAQCNGIADAFQVHRKAIANARLAAAGKRKAKLTLEDNGIGRVWEFYENRSKHEYKSPQAILADIASNVIRYGEITEKQAELCKKLLHQIDNAAEIEAERAREYEAAAPCPTGRVKITGKVLTTRTQEGFYRTEFKMLVVDDTGFKVWGSIPGDLQIFDDPATGFQRGLKHGDRVSFTATVTPKEGDPKFGFFSRPTKASVELASAPAQVEDTEEQNLGSAN